MTDEDKLLAAIEFIRRTGAKSVQVRYSDDEQPVIWFVAVEYLTPTESRWEAAAGFDALEAALRFCEHVADGGMCVHCHRRTGFEPKSLGRMPFDDVICWYQYDPELKTFRRGCE